MGMDLFWLTWPYRRSGLLEDFLGMTVRREFGRGDCEECSLSST